MQNIRKIVLTFALFKTSSELTLSTYIALKSHKYAVYLPSSFVTRKMPSAPRTFTAIHAIVKFADRELEIKTKTNLTAAVKVNFREHASSK